MTGLYSPTETGQLLANSVAQAIERTGHVPGSGTRGDSARLWSTLAELGFAGIGVDPRHGGAGGQLADLAPALTLLGQKLCITPAITSMVCATWLIEAAGSARQAGDRLPALAEGALTAALAHTEHAARNHPHFVETRARRAADGWVLDGAKPIVPDGGTAGLFVVSARTSGTPAHADGISLFLVPAGAPGLGCRTVSLHDGSQAASLAFDGLTLPADALLASEGKAAPLIEAATDRAIAALCADAVGVMEGLFELTRDYLRTREQFGQPIGRFQALQHRMADLFIELELARSMAGYAIAAADLAEARQRASAISAAKHVIANAARKIGQDCVQLHGAIALTGEYAAGHYFKRLTLIERQFGGADYHLDRFAGLAA